MSKLLINEQPLQVIPSLANEVGLEEAIAIQQLHYRQKWLEDNQVESQKIDSKYWVTASYKEWKEKDFPFWSIAKIGRVFRSIEELQFIESAQHDVGNWDRSKSYRIDRIEFERWSVSVCTLDDSDLNALDDSDLNGLHSKENLREVEENSIPYPFKTKSSKPDREAQREFHSHEVNHARDLFFDVVAIPMSSASNHFGVVNAMVDKYGLDETREAMKSAFEKWTNTHSEKTGKPYNPHNYEGWLEWALNELDDDKQIEHNKDGSLYI
jgi:hypothetical protein